MYRIKRIKQLNLLANSKLHWRFFLSAPIYLATNLIFVMPVSAEEKQRDSRLVIEEVTVTAQRKEQSANDVSIAITAFSADQMKSLGITDTRDLGKLPSFSYADTGFMIPIFTIRGVGFTDSSATSSSTVGIYIDQASLPFPVMATGANLDLERVEILKGPQGTLYGRNTTAGLINYISAKPTTELSYGAEFGFERFERYSAEGYVSGPLFDNALNGSLLGRFAYKKVKSNEGWQKSLTRSEDTRGLEDKDAARGSLSWSPNDDWQVNLTGTWWRDQSDSQAAQAVALQNNDGSTTPHPDPRVANHPIVSMDTDDLRIADWPSERAWQVNNEFAMATLSAQWSGIEAVIINYLGVVQDFVSDDSEIPNSGLSVNNSEFQTSIDIAAYSHELRFSGALFNESVDWQFGGYISRDTVDVDQTVFSESLSTGGSPAGNLLTDVVNSTGYQLATTEAVFAQLDWSPLSALKFTAGLRYNRDAREFEGCLRDGGDQRSQGVGLGTTFTLLSGSVVPPGGCVTLDENGTPNLIKTKLQESSVARRVSVDWTPYDDGLIYLSYSRGFKSGGSVALFGATSFEAYEPIVAERVDAYELGAKFSLLDRSVQLNSAIFSYDYKNKQLRSFYDDPAFGPQEAVDNVPKSTIRGAELELRALPMIGLEVALSASYLETEIKEYTGLDFRGEERDLSGNEFNFTPNWEYTAIVTYNLPISETLALEVGLDVNYTDEAKATLDNDPVFAIDDYTLIGYRAGVQHIDDSWGVEFWGKNVTNEYYVSNIITGTGDTVRRFTGKPQTYGLTLSYRY